jgi:PIN domain nuclease of toxin-antitoxin system
VNDPEVVADASAVLALLKDEEFGEFDPECLVGAAISAVNFSEVLAELGSGGLTEAEADAAVAALDLNVIAFDEHQARSVARLWPAVRRFGLSLADRACLALGLRLGRPVVTADRAWGKLDIGIEIVLIR